MPLPHPPLRPPLPRLLAVSDASPVVESADARRERWASWLAELAAADVDGVQLRDRTLSDLECFECATLARSQVGAPRSIWIHRRADIALAAAADGVQLPAAGAPLAPLRRRFGRQLRFGRSTHTLDEVHDARADGADLVIFGPVFATPSKAGLLEPRGLDTLAKAVEVGPPVLAIGGIDFENAAAVAATGAWGIAAIRLFGQPSRQAGRLRALRALWPAS